MISTPLALTPNNIELLRMQNEIATRTSRRVMFWSTRKKYFLIILSKQHYISRQLVLEPHQLKMITITVTQCSSKEHFIAMKKFYAESRKREENEPQCLYRKDEIIACVIISWWNSVSQSAILLLHHPSPDVQPPYSTNVIRR